MCGKLRKLHAPNSDGNALCGRSADGLYTQAPIVAPNTEYFNSWGAPARGFQHCKSCQKKLKKA